MQAQQIIREAAREDAEALAALFCQHAAFDQRLSNYYEIERDFDWAAYVKNKIAQRDRTIIIAEEHSKIVGFIHIRIAAHPEPARNTLKNRLSGKHKPGNAQPLKSVSWGFIEDCFVLESCRQRGIGASLVSGAMSWFKNRGVNRIALGVLANNSAAKHFWEKFGFQTYRLQLHKRIDT